MHTQALDLWYGTRTCPIDHAGDMEGGADTVVPTLLPQQMHSISINLASAADLPPPRRSSRTRTLSVKAAEAAEAAGSTLVTGVAEQ